MFVKKMSLINKTKESISDEHCEEEYIKEESDYYEDNELNMSNLDDFDNSLRVSLDLINKINNVVDYQSKQLKKEINKVLIKY